MSDLAWLKRAEEGRRVYEELTRLRAIVDKLPKTADGVPVVPGVDYGWSGTWDELENNGQIYRSKPWRSLILDPKDAASLFSSEAVALAQPVRYTQNVFSAEGFISPDYWCEVCENGETTCDACCKMLDEAGQRADALNEKSESLISEYPKRSIAETAKATP